MIFFKFNIKITMVVLILLLFTSFGIFINIGMIPRLFPYFPTQIKIALLKMQIQSDWVFCDEFNGKRNKSDIRLYKVRSKEFAIRKLGEYNNDANSIVPFLIRQLAIFRDKYLGEEMESYQSITALTLGQLGDKQAIDPLIAVLLLDDYCYNDFLNFKPVPAKNAAVEALGNLGESAVKATPYIISQLKCKENCEPEKICEYKIIKAIDALGKIRDPAAIPELINVIQNNTSSDILSWAINALSNYKSDAEIAIPYLRKNLQNTSDHYLRQKIRRAITAIGGNCNDDFN